MKKRKGRRSQSVKAATCNKPADIGNGDGLSKLPNDVLLNILEKLDTLDAVRTCALSKEMLRLPTMLPQFVIDIGFIIGHGEESSLYDLIRVNRSVVADAREEVLSTRSPGISIPDFSVRFFLEPVPVDFLYICTFFARAMATYKVGAAEFEILTEKSAWNYAPADLLYFAKQFNTFLGAFPDVFAGLTSLRLENMMFGEQDIPNILCTCKRLESLCISSCDSGTHSVLQLEHAQLVELEIDRGRFARVELTCLPKLRQVRYNTCQCPHQDHSLFFGFTPQLSKLSLAKTDLGWHKILELSEFFANVPSINDLHLDFRSEQIWVQPECPKLLAPVFGKLRHVNLDNLPEGCDIAWTMFILEAAPSLEELCITVWDHWCNMWTFRQGHDFCRHRADLEWEPSSPDFKHKNLVKLTIYGFLPNDKFVRYIRRVMVAAVNMVEISLHDRKVCSRCKDKIKVNMEEISLHDRKLCKVCKLWKPCKRCKDKMKLNMEDDRKLCNRCVHKIKFCPSRYPRTGWEEYFLTEEIRKGLGGMASPAVIDFWS